MNTLPPSSPLSRRRDGWKAALGSLFVALALLALLGNGQGGMLRTHPASQFQGADAISGSFAGKYVLDTDALTELGGFRLKNSKGFPTPMALPADGVFSVVPTHRSIPASVVTSVVGDIAPCLLPGAPRAPPAQA